MKDPLKSNENVIEADSVREYILYKLQTYLNSPKEKRAKNIIRMAKQLELVEDALIIYKETLPPRA